MQWTETVLIANQDVIDPAGLIAQPVIITDVIPPPDRQVLCYVGCTEDADHADAYSALTCVAFAPTPAAPWRMQLTPLTELTDVEQGTLRTWLIARRWAAWARAPLHVRTMLGVTAPPVQLAEAARQLDLPVATLGRAAQFGRLPVVHAGDRRLVYVATIEEARTRHLLHDQVGRPRRGAPARPRR